MSDKVLTDKQRLAINYYIINGCNKSEVARRCKVTQQTINSMFDLPHVRAEVDRRFKLMDAKIEQDKEWLAQKLIAIIEAEEPIEFDHKGRPSLNFNLVTGGLKNLMGKVCITEVHKKVKYGQPIREVKYVNVTAADKLNAMKELAILRGWREEKSKVQLEQDVISALRQGASDAGTQS